MARPVINERAFLEPRLRAVDEYLRAHLAEPQRLSESAAARIANVTPGHLCRLFRLFVGAPFTEWQHAVRTEEAKRRIVERAFLLRRVSELVGFARYETFCRVFTRVEGVSPKRLRPFVREYPELADVVCWHTTVFILRIAPLARSRPQCLRVLAEVADLFSSPGYETASRRR
jgi:AraC-like DNA-binding protein